MPDFAAAFEGVKSTKNSATATAGARRELNILAASPAETLAYLAFPLDTLGPDFQSSTQNLTYFKND